MNWKILKTSGFLLFLVTFFVGCNNPHPDFKKTDSGIYYKIISRVDSLKDIKADSGKFYIMDMNYGTADSVIFKSVQSREKIVKMPFREKVFDGDVWEALSLLSKGDSAQFIIRADSFFLKTTRAPQVPEIFKEKNEVYFFINLKDIKTKEEMEAEQAAYANARRIAEQIEVSKFKADQKWTGKALESGLEIKKIKKGKGRRVKEGEFITFDFEIRFLDGKLAYSSIESNRPASYEYGKRFDTKGLMEALGTMRQGDEVELLIPSSLALGERGRPGMVEPYTALHYFVRLTDVKTKAEHEAELEAKRKNEAAKLEKAIKNIINTEIKAAAERARKSKEEKKSKIIDLTSEEFKLTNDFVGNKGKLPWPSEKGIISSTFGEHKHPVLRKVKVKNNGIDILTDKDGIVQTVFSGTVISVRAISNTNTAIIIRHGEYFTVYSNLNKVFVKRGDKVQTKQEIGTVFTNPSDSKTELHFEIWKGRSLLNPAYWIVKKD